MPQELQGAKVVEQLGKTLPLNFQFTNEEGQKVSLDQYFHHDRPVVLQFVYYSCPMLCNLMLNGFNDSLKKMDWVPGKEFDVVTISINPKEGAALAKVKKTNYITEYGKPEGAAGWHWFASEDNQVQQLADAAGWHYKWDERQQQYAHEAAIIVCTSEGKISRYLWGISFPPKDMRLALLEAGEGKIGSTLDHIILFCYHYDPQNKHYAMVATRVMQAGAAATVVILGSVVGGFLWFERRGRKRKISIGRPPDADSGTPPAGAGAAHV